MEAKMHTASWSRTKWRTSNIFVGLAIDNINNKNVEKEFREVAAVGTADFAHHFLLLCEEFIVATTRLRGREDIRNAHTPKVHKATPIKRPN